MPDPTTKSIPDGAGASPHPGTAVACEGASAKPRLTFVMDAWSRAIVEWHVVAADDAATTTG